MPVAKTDDIFNLGQTPLDENFLIEASAGTGKTFSLIHIVLRLIVEKDLPIERQLLVTFTKAATAELRERVRRLLMQMRNTLAAPEVQFTESEQEALYEKWLASGLTHDEILSRIKNALDEMDDCNICTIHSFCQSVLEDASFSSAEGFEYELGEDTELKHRIVGEFLREEILKTDNPRLKLALSTERPWLDKLALLMKSPRDVQIQYRKPLADVDPKTGAALEIVDEAFEAELSAVMQRFTGTVPERLFEEKKRSRIRTFDDLLLSVYEASKEDSFRNAVRSRFDAVLIDEFQDTDPIQYRIFERIFIEPATESAKRPLVIFVGDPKQSIYRFRNADIDTYLHAARDIKKYRLKSNFRSCPALVEACNGFFADQDTQTAFFNEHIHYSPVDAQSRKEPLTVETMNGDRMLPAFEYWHRASLGEKLATKDNTLQENTLIASEINALTSGRVYKDRAKTQPLKAGDICVLVRQKNNIPGLIKALAEYKIRAIAPETTDVFLTDEADDILKVLYALENIHDIKNVKLARTTRLMGESVNEVSPDCFEVGDAGDENTLKARQLLEEAQTIWPYAGPAGAFALIMQRCNTRERLLPQRDGERRLTNYTHVIELLQQELSSNRSISGITHWFERNIPPEDSTADAPEERQLRLDSDADLVTIMTIHKSKGLEFPVVILLHPQSHKMKQKQHVRKSVFKHVSDSTISFEFSHTELYPDVDSANYEQEKNELTRQVYVAMTRASQRLIVPMLIPRSRSGKKPAAVDNAYAWAVLKSKNGTDAEILSKAVRSLVEKLQSESPTPDAFAVRLIDDQDESIAWHALCPKIEKEPETVKPLQAAPARPVLTEWLPTSYTALARGAEELSETEVRSMEVEDELPEVESETPIVANESATEGLQSQALTVNDLPRGLEAGTFIHSLFERVDFALVRETLVNPSALEKVKNTVSRQIRLFAHLFTDRSAEEYTNVATELLINVLNATIVDQSTARQLGLQNPLILSTLAPGTYAREMAFTVPISPAKADDFEATPAGLSALLKTFDSRYHVTLPSYRDLTGFLTGAIDLTFEFEGRYYVLDWKGTRLEDYGPGDIQAQMQKHHYPLQYLIYLVALKRYLALCGVKNPTEKLGGVFYVFVRGVRKDDCPPKGILFDKPSAKLIDALDEFFACGLSVEALQALKLRAR